MSKRLRSRIGVLLIATTIGAGMPIQAQSLDYKGHWAEAQLVEWVERGILSGYEDGTIRPNVTVTRAEFAKILAEVFGLEYSDESYLVYDDVKEEAWYSDYIAYAVSANLMKVDEGKFRPNAPITREEAAYAVATAYHISQEGEMRFKDTDSMSEWAQKEINALALQGYLRGYEDGTFRPQNHLTRAEAIMMLDQITADIINEAGTYTKDIQGNVVVNTTDVILKDMTIHGNLYLAEGIGEGDVTLDHVVVTGQTIVEGGGQHSIELVGTNLDHIVVSKATGAVRLAADQSSTMGHVQVQSAVQLEGKIEQVEVGTIQEVKLVGATVEEVKVVQPDAKVVLDQDTVLEKLIVDAKVEISGEGAIQKAEINANGVKIEGVNLDKDNITVDSSVSQQPELEVEVPSTGGSSSGSSSSDSPSDSDIATPVQPVEKAIIQGCVKLEETLAVGAEVGLYKMISGNYSERVAKAVTDANGNYTFKEVEAGEYRLEIKYHLDGNIYETYVDKFPVGKETVVKDIVLEKKASTAFEFTVTTKEGPLAYATVTAKAYVPGVTNWSSGDVTDANGQTTLSSRFTFPIGTQVSVTVEKQGYKTYTGTYIITAEGMNQVSITLEKEELVPPQVTQVTVTPTEVVTKNSAAPMEFIIELPQEIVLKDEFPAKEYLRTTSSSLEVSTLVPKRIDAHTLSVEAIFKQIGQDAWFKFYIDPKFLATGQIDVVTPKIKVISEEEILPPVSQRK